MMKSSTSISIRSDRLSMLLLAETKDAYHKVTQSNPRFYCHPNLLMAGRKQMNAAHVEHSWAADIPYQVTECLCKLNYCDLDSIEVDTASFIITLTCASANYSSLIRGIFWQ